MSLAVKQRGLGELIGELRAWRDVDYSWTGVNYIIARDSKHAARVAPFVNPFFETPILAESEPLFLLLVKSAGARGRN